MTVAPNINRGNPSNLKLCFYQSDDSILAFDQSEACLPISANQKLVITNQTKSRAKECHNDIGKYPDARVTIRISQESLLSSSQCLLHTPPGLLPGPIFGLNPPSCHRLSVGPLSPESWEWFIKVATIRAIMAPLAIEDKILVFVTATDAAQYWAEGGVYIFYGRDKYRGETGLQRAQLHRVTQSNTLSLCTYFVVSFGAGFSTFSSVSAPSSSPS